MIEGPDSGVVARGEDGREHRLPRSSRRRAEAIDRHVAARVRGRRVMLGLTQQQLAELVGITVQQACKYETASSRVAAGRLYHIAQALRTDVGYFFEAMGRTDTLEVTPQQRRLLALARDFVAIRSRRHQEELISLTRALAEPDAGRLAVRGSRWRVIWPG